VENAMLQGGKAKRKPAETMIDNRGKRNRQLFRETKFWQWFKVLSHDSTMHLKKTYSILLKKIKN